MQIDHLETKHHRVHLSEQGLSIYSTDNLDPEDEGFGPRDEDILQLSPMEALWVATYVMEHQEQIAGLQSRLDRHCEEVSQEVLQAFPAIYKQFAPSPSQQRRGAGLDFEQALSHTLIVVLNNNESKAAQWMYAEAHGYEIAAKKAHFWRHFNDQHRDSLIEQYIKPEEEGEE